MKIITIVCNLFCYDDAKKTVLDRLEKCCDEYATKIVALFGCPKETIESYIYMAITTVPNYMIFSGESYIDPQMEMLKRTISKMKYEFSKNVNENTKYKI